MDSVVISAIAFVIATNSIANSIRIHNLESASALRRDIIQKTNYCLPRVD